MRALPCLFRLLSPVHTRCAGVGLSMAMLSLAVFVSTGATTGFAQTPSAAGASPSVSQPNAAPRPRQAGAGDVSVQRRPRLDFESYGLALDEVVGNESGVARAVGSFDLYTQVESGVGYTSNLYKQETAEEGSSIAQIRPQIALRSDWARHELNVIAVGNIERYGASEDDNVLGGKLGLDGRLDGPEGISIRGGTSVTSSHLGRDDDLDLGRGF